MAAFLVIDLTDSHQPWTRATAKAGQLLAPWILYLLTAVWLTWPTAALMTSAVPLGLEGEATVPLFNLWTVWWNIDRLGHGFHDYWNAPVFHPAPLVFALSEPQPTTVVLAPLYWITGSPTLCYNVAILGVMTLNGHAAWSLLRLLKTPWWLALLGGLLLQRLPFLFWQMGVLQLLSLAGPIWTIYWLVKCCREPRWTSAIGLGASFGLTYWACNYYGLLLSISLGTSFLLLVVSGWPLLPVWRRWQPWACLAGAGVLAACMIGPMARVQQESAREQAWHDERPLDLARNLSARWSDYTWSLTSRLGDYPTAIEPARQNVWRLGCGAMVTVLGCAGLIVGLTWRDRRLLTCAVLTFSVVSMLLSFGPDYEIMGWPPSLWLRDHYPGFAHLRSPFRFGVFAQLGWHLLAIQGIELFTPSRWPLEKRWPAPPQPSQAQRGLHAAICGALWLPATILAGLSVYEVWPLPQTCHSVVAVSPRPAWIDYLLRETDEAEALACIPFPDGTDARAYESTTTWMYWQTQHHRPLINGYSGFFPDAYLDLRDAMENFPDDSSISQLAQLGTRYLVIDLDAVDLESFENTPLFADQTELCLKDLPSGVAIYRFTPRFVGPIPDAL
ncbi:MAG: hypothetical protein C0478_05595 [Planctomyces sp.]|nr:hypothetical protein [Planctomyces sp.]